MLEPEARPARQDRRQVGVAVAVPVAHAAAEEHERAVQQRVLAVSDGQELVEEV